MQVISAAWFQAPPLPYRMMQLTSSQAMLTFLIQCTGHLPVWACLVSICFPRSIQGLLLRQLYFERRSDSWLSDAELVCSQQLASNNRTQELQQKSRGVNQRSSPHPSRSWTQILMGHQTRLSESRTRQPPPLPKNPCLGRSRVPCVWSQTGDSCPHPNAGHIRPSPDGFDATCPPNRFCALASLASS